MQEQPRGPLFHWVANMTFAGIAVGAGVLFGLRVPENRVSLVVAVIALVAFLMIPLTRRWDRDGVATRQAEQDTITGRPEGGADRNL